MKKAMALLLVFTLAVLFTSCSQKKGEIQSQVSSVVSATKSAARDKTVAVPNTLQMDMGTIPPDKIQKTSFSTEKIKAYKTINELMGDTEEVIRGKILKVEYFTVGKVAYTKADISVSEVLKGSLTAGDTITVCKTGGYALLKSIDPDIQQKFPKMTDAELNQTVVDVSFEGDPHPQAGQEGVFFLNTKFESLPKGAYMTVGDYLGEFQFAENNVLKRHTADAGNSEGIAANNKAQTNSADQAFTYAGLKEAVLNSEAG